MMTPMMKCGHAANATNSDGKPVCAICILIGLGADEVAATPALSGRIAKCSYTKCHETWLRKHDTHYGEFGADGQSFAPSSTNLPFFEHKPDKPFDEYFCGCWGWD